MSSFSQKFSVDSALLQELGERLVTTPHVALAELVKNAYDADATEVRVTIREGENSGPEIVVEDNGCGMTLKQIKDYWMRIGNPHKEKQGTSLRFGRPLTGSKGIGRFCVRRLGSAVRLESTAFEKRKLRFSALDINWKDFIPGKDVASVPVKGRTDPAKGKKTGLKLIMSGLGWIEWRPLEDQRSYAYLLRQLATLAANRGAHRDGFELDPGFKVMLNAPALEYGAALAGYVDAEEDKSEGRAVDIRERLMNAGWALLTADVEKDGKVKCTLESANPVGKRDFTSVQKFSTLHDISLKLAIFVEEPGWNRNEKLVPTGKLNTILNDWGGVQLRQRGMRIFPYGDPGDDWLDIERDRARRLGKPPQDDLINFANTLKARTPLETGRVLLNMLSPKAYLGAVEVGDSQTGLVAKADREGYVENKVFQELKQFVRFAIDWAMIWRDFGVKQKARQAAEKHRLELEAGTGKVIPATQAPDFALKLIRKGVQQLRSAKEADDLSTITPEDVQNLGSAVSLLESEFKNNKADLLRFQLVASAATLTLLYHHEVKYLAENLSALSVDLDDAVHHLKGNLKARCQELLGTVSVSQESLKALGDLTDEMGVGDRRATAGNHDLATQTDRAIARFRRVAEAYRVEITKRIDEGLLVGPMLKGELAAVLLNVLSNAIKAVIASGSRKGLIELSAYRAHGKVCLDINDNGIGLPAQEREAAFNPLVSDPASNLYDALEERLASEDRSLLGQGSGLGLSIVRGLLENRKGQVEFVDAQNGWVTCVHVEFPTP
jgi:signal transduction histidine kinase